MGKITLGSRFKAAASAFRAVQRPISDRSWWSYNGETDSGVTVTATTAEKYSAVFGCVKIYEDVVGTLPIEVKAQDRVGKPSVDVDYLVKLLRKPNDIHDPVSFWTLVLAWLQTNGNAVSVIKRGGFAEPLELIPVSWHSTNIRLTSKGIPVYFINDTEMGVNGEFMPWEVLHFRINCRTPWIGRSPLTAAREAIGLGIAAEKFGSSYFKKGGNLKGVLETESTLSDDAFKVFKKRWDKQNTGMAGDHTTPLLEYGIKYKTIGINPNDAQFLETRVHQVQDVARFFGVPPSLIGENSRNTFTNGEQQNLQFLTYSVSPLCTRLESELEAKLLREVDREKVAIKFMLNSLQRGDMAARSNFGRTMTSSGIYTRNEIRVQEGLPPLPGLDVPLNPAFLTGKGANNGTGGGGNDGSGKDGGSGSDGSGNSGSGNSGSGNDGGDGSDGKV